MQAIGHACAFIGHGSHKLPWKEDGGGPRCAALRALLAEHAALLAAWGITAFYVGMAHEVDVWAAQAVLELKEARPDVRLHCVVASPGRAPRWTLEAQGTYRAILGAADKVEDLGRTRYAGCGPDRSRYMVHRAGTLLAVYNGERRGGTATTLRYARKLGRRVIVIDPASGTVRE